MINTSEFKSAILKVGNAVQVEIDSLVAYIKKISPEDAEAYFTKAGSAVDKSVDKMKGIAEDVVTEALLSLLNGMVDATKDGLLKPITDPQVRPFARALNSYYEGEDQVKRMDREWQVAWLALFPLTFKLTTPPPGSVSKVTSTAAAPKEYPQFSYVLERADGTLEGMANNMAQTFVNAIGSTSHTITHMVPATPSPVPGPPITTTLPTTAPDG